MWRVGASVFLSRKEVPVRSSLYRLTFVFAPFRLGIWFKNSNDSLAEFLWKYHERRNKFLSSHLIIILLIPILNGRKFITLIRFLLSQRKNNFCTIGSDDATKSSWNLIKLYFFSPKRDTSTGPIPHPRGYLLVWVNKPQLFFFLQKNGRFLISRSSRWQVASGYER